MFRTMKEDKNVPFGKLNDHRSLHDKETHYNKVNTDNQFIGAVSSGQSAFVNYGPQART
jgi:hypothetical protein